MLKPHQFASVLLTVLTGCTMGAFNEKRPPNWNADDGTVPAVEVDHVAAVPRVNAPPKAPVLAPSQVDQPAATWIPLAHWSTENHIGEVTLISLTPSPRFALRTSAGLMELQSKSLVAEWNGLQFHLGFEPRFEDGQLLIDNLDLTKNIVPLLQGFSIPSKPGRVVVIDPGHGGVNGGTTDVLDGTTEKQFTLDWAKRLKPLLEAEGWQVFLTRSSDIDLSLSNRVAIADAHNADLFISLHFNSAAPNQAQSGLETFCLTPHGMPSTLTRGYDDNPSLTFTNNAFDAENLDYAAVLHRVLLKATGMEDRGVRRARFLGVLRGQNRPAVLIEGGYLSNPREARRIGDPEYREQLANAVAQALAPAEPAMPGLESGTQLSGVKLPGPAVHAMASEVQSSNAPTTTVLH